MPIRAGKNKKTYVPGKRTEFSVGNCALVKKTRKRRCILQLVLSRRGLSRQGSERRKEAVSNKTAFYSPKLTRRKKGSWSGKKGRGDHLHYLSRKPGGGEEGNHPKKSRSICHREGTVSNPQRGGGPISRSSSRNPISEPRTGRGCHLWKECCAATKGAGRYLSWEKKEEGLGSFRSFQGEENFRELGGIQKMEKRQNWTMEKSAMLPKPKKEGK